MSQLRSHFNLRAAFVLLLLITGGAVLASGPDNMIGSVFIRPEIGTAAQQESVRTSREVMELPLRSTCTVKPAKELFITDLSVVNDCHRTTWRTSCPQPAALPVTQGAWTLGRLLEGIFGTTDPVTLSSRTLTWLNEWKVNQTVNGDLVPARPAIQTAVIDAWPKRNDGSLDMRKAPFRLQAIVTRLDLRNLSTGRGGPHAGEARFIFNLLDAAGEPTLFNVILEYKLDASDCQDVMDWARDFHALGAIPFGPDYNAALQAVTDRFTTIGASPGKPNGSAIAQVRSNEVELSAPWELREFRLSGGSTGALLLQSTVDLTPFNKHQHSQLLADFINAHPGSIKNNNYTVPLTENGQPFRGGAARHNLNRGWDGPVPCTSVTDLRARRIFSLNTCSGCHGTPETGTEFLQVVPRSATSAAALSGFLTGIAVTDPCGRPVEFNDIDRRRVDLCQLLEKTCTQIEEEPPVSYTH